MRSWLVRTALLLLSSVGVLRGQAPLSCAEIITLLEVGVPSEAILEALAKRGAPAAVFDEDLESAAQNGASKDLLSVLERHLVDVRRLEELARRFDTFEHSESGVGFLVPRRWETSALVSENRVFFELAPKTAPLGMGFKVPRIFIWFERDAGAIKDSEAPLADRLQRIIFRRLRSAEMQPRWLESTKGKVAGDEVPHLEVSLVEPGTHASGVLGTRFLVTPRGDSVLVGFLSATEVAAEVRALHDEIARSLALPKAP